MTDFPAIKRVLEREEGLTITDFREAWKEYESIEAVSKMEQVNEHNANRWMAAAEDWQAEAWNCFVASGADYSGRDREHLKFGQAVRAVKELRADYDEALKEGVKGHRRVTDEAIEIAKEHYPKLQPHSGSSPHNPSSHTSSS